MSTLAPGEVDNRVCYTCNSSAPAPDMSAPVDDDLNLQPLDGGSGHYHATKGNVRRQMEQQIRSSGLRAGVTSKANLPAVRKSAVMPAARISNSGMPAARVGSNPSMPAAKPAGRSTQSMPAVRSGGSTRINIQPATPTQPPADGTEIELEAQPEEVAPIPAPRVSSARTMAVRSSARHRAVHVENKGGSPLVFVAIGVMVLVAGVALYFAMGSSGGNDAPVATATAPAKPTLPPPVTNTAAPVTPPVETVPAKPQVVETAPAKPAKTEKVEAPAPAAPETAAAVPAPEEKPAAAKTDAASAAPLFVSKRATNAKLDDEEAMVELGETKTGKKSTPAGKDEVAAADPKKPVDALGGMGITGTKKKKPEEDVPVFDDIRKAKPVIPVTSTEPTIIKEDLTAGDQNPEKQFSQSIQEQFPGWRVRDITLDQSQSMFTSAEHRGKKDVLILNPLNDTLPAKLYCTVEIPKEFSGKRPMLAFEVSTKDKNADWFLAVKCMNVDMRPKAAIRCPDEAKWQPVVVDLSALAGKRFELAIETYMTPKANKKLWKDERAYIRNVQLMWSGKK